VPDPLAAITRKCLQTDSQDRYGSIAELLIALDGFLSAAQREEG
jgi:hypothetical protein